MPCILPGTLAHPNASECILKTLTGSSNVMTLFQLSSFMHHAPMSGIKQNGT